MWGSTMQRQASTKGLEHQQISAPPSAPLASSGDANPKFSPIVF